MRTGGRAYLASGSRCRIIRSPQGSGGANGEKCGETPLDVALSAAVEIIGGESPAPCAFPNGDGVLAEQVKFELLGARRTVAMGKAFIWQEGPCPLSDDAHGGEVSPIVYAVPAPVSDYALGGLGADARNTQKLVFAGVVDVHGEGVQVFDRDGGLRVLVEGQE